MWYVPDKYKIDVPNLNKNLLEMEGELDDEKARISLAKFLRGNIGFTTELISGVRLAGFQEIVLKAFLNRNFSMCVFSRGGGKSFLAAVFCFLQCIFEPNSKIIIAGPTFRTARLIFGELEKIVNSKQAKLLRDCFETVPSKRNDIFEWHINGGIIRAIPLNGEKIRGFRANVLVLDEYLLLSEDTIKNVLMPFLVAPQNVAERMKIREMETELIKKGALKESERIKFENNSKMICLSSASYTFENLYKTYRSWIDKMEMPEDEERKELDREMPDLVKESVPKYFIAQLGYEALPAHMVDPTIIQEANSGGANNASFMREYQAQFTDGSDSYFSAVKMKDCTIDDNSLPTTEIVGNKGSEYILSIDPSFSNSPSSDHFAMAVLLLDHETQKPTLVHNYAVAGGDLKDHHKYLYFLLTYFNIRFILIDNAGAEFIDSANESMLFKNTDKEIKFMDFDTALEGQDYINAVKAARAQYNVEHGCIAVKQFFSSAWIRRANEHLKGLIDYKKIWFASKMNLNGGKYQQAVEQHIDLDLIPFKDVTEFIDFQDDWIHQTKKQCSLVEIKTSSQGTQSFDLPSHLKKSTRPDRARKDSYTTLLLGAWANKCYYDIMNMQEDNIEETFEPFIIG